MGRKTKEEANEWIKKESKYFRSRLMGSANKYKWVHYIYKMIPQTTSKDSVWIQKWNNNSGKKITEHDKFHSFCSSAFHTIIHFFKINSQRRDPEKRGREQTQIMKEKYRQIWTPRLTYFAFVRYGYLQALPCEAIEIASRTLLSNFKRIQRAKPICKMFYNLHMPIHIYIYLYCMSVFMCIYNRYNQLFIRCTRGVEHSCMTRFVPEFFAVWCLHFFFRHWK